MSNEITKHTQNHTPSPESAQTLEPENNNLPQREFAVKRKYSGPLPPPEALEHYDSIIPGAAERILTMAEQNAAHRRNIESRALDAKRRENRRGQLLGFGIGVIALSVAGLAVYLGYPTTASVIGGGTVVGIVAAFVTGRVRKK